MTDTTEQSAFPDLSNITSVDEGRRKLGEFLGLTDLASHDVFLSVIENPTYANSLFAARVEPVFRDHLLAHPPNRWEDRDDTAPSLPPAEEIASPQADLSTTALLSRATKSLANWTATGFKKVDDDTIRQRRAACDACPHHIAPPKKILYQLATALKRRSEEPMICELCGCITENKIRFAHESCPGADENRPGFTRWGDPMPVRRRVSAS